jgi:hypothetical protein
MPATDGVALSAPMETGSGLDDRLDSMGSGRLSMLNVGFEDRTCHVEASIHKTHRSSGAEVPFEPAHRPARRRNSDFDTTSSDETVEIIFPLIISHNISAYNNFIYSIRIIDWE